MRSAAGVHPQATRRRARPRRGLGTEGTGLEVGQAAFAIDVEARLARPIQGALARPVLAGVGTVPVVKALVAVVAAPPSARRPSRA